MESQSYTVIIPTRERCDTLIAALKSVTSQDNERLQIIVSDNFSKDQTKDVVDDARDPRILYVNPGQRLSMSKHWEYALSHATNEWITIMGDDDALLPDCLAKVGELASGSRVSMIRSAVCQYMWPRFNDAEFARMVVPMRSGVEVRKGREQLSKTLRGWDNYRGLPMIYNGGFVKRSVVSAASQNGRFFYSCIPDVFSGVMLSHVLDEFLFVNEPLALNGASSHSTGASQFSAIRKAGSPSSLFRSEGNIDFHPSVPMTDGHDYPASLPAMIYESCAQVSDLMQDSLQIEPAMQLRVILAAVNKDHDLVIPWARKFANQHNLSFEKEMALSKLRRVGYSLQRKYQRLRSRRNTRISGQDIDISDSFRASRVAFNVLRSQPIDQLPVAA